tara:strand:- start:26 stop:1249 length:1224 start_codon:yes stop_codon:yes gene_type:complete
MAQANFLLYLAKFGYGDLQQHGIQLENSDVNDLVLNGTDGSSSNEGDNIITEDVLLNHQLVTEETEERGTIRLDGIEPLPDMNFITLNGTDASSTNAGDNIVYETHPGGSTDYDVDRMIMENSIITFRSDEVLDIGFKLLQDDDLNAQHIPISDIGDIPFKDIQRESRILSEQPFDLLNPGKLSPKIITEYDGVTPLSTEDNKFLILEDAAWNEANDPHRAMRSGQGDIDSGFSDQHGIQLEGDGVLILDGTNDAQDNAGEHIVDETNRRRFELEENGVMIQESYDVSSHVARMLFEDSITEKRMRLETSLEPEEIDKVLLETSDASNDYYVLDETDGDKIRHEQDFKDIELLIENILLEETHVVGNRGQIPVENYSIGVDQDRPLALIAKGQQPIVQSSYIIQRSS